MVKLQEDGSPTHPEILSFAEQLKKGRGLTIVAAVLPGEFNDLFDEARRQRQLLSTLMDEAGVTGFPLTFISESYQLGMQALLQSVGLGPLRPNTLLLGWPRPWREDPAWADTFVQTVGDAFKTEIAVLCCRGLSLFPVSKKQKMHGRIDVWWFIRILLTTHRFLFLSVAP